MEILRRTPWSRIKGQNSVYKEFLEICWQWEANGQCVKEDYCSFRHDMNKRGKSRTIKSVSEFFMRQSERKPSRTRSPIGKSPSDRMSRWPCKDYLWRICNNSFCEKWHPPEVCSTTPRVVVGLGRSAHSHIVRLMSSRWKGLKRIMTKVPWLCWKREICKKENLSPMDVTIDWETWEKRW